MLRCRLPIVFPNQQYASYELNLIFPIMAGQASKRQALMRGLYQSGLGIAYIQLFHPSNLYGVMRISFGSLFIRRKYEDHYLMNMKNVPALLSNKLFIGILH